MTTPAQRPVRVGTTAAGGLVKADARERARLAAHIVDAGLDHITVADHVSFHVGFGMDGLVNATAMAILFPTLPVHLGVYLLPLRNPVLVARQLSTFSELAPGRLVFGVGVGGEDRHEVEVCSVDPATRGSRTDESLDVLKQLMTGQAVTHHGRFFDIDNCKIVPAPSPPIPIAIGGRSPAALERAARFGDGWLGVWCGPERFRSEVVRLEERANELGRAGVAWDHGIQMWVGLGPTRDEARSLLAAAMFDMYRIPFERFERYSPYGSPREVADALAPYVEAGCRYFNLMGVAASPESSTDGLAEVRSLLRAG